MTSKRKGATRPQRSRHQTYVHIGKKSRQQIRDLSKFYPALNKLKNKTRITSQEAGLLTRAKKALRHTENLRPLTEKQAEQLRKQGKGDLIIGKGVRAIRLNNTAPNATVKVLKSGVIVTSNGRTWEYHEVIPIEPENLIDIGTEILSRPDIAQIHLWTVKGRANEGFAYPAAWARWVADYFERYEEQEQWMRGIAALRSKKPIKEKHANAVENAKSVKRKTRAGKDGTQ